MIPPVVYHPRYRSDIGTHVFPTMKYPMIFQALTERVDGLRPRVFSPHPVSRDQAARVHTRKYLDDLVNLRATRRTRSSELPLTREIIDAYFLMTGGSCLAADLALTHGAAMNIGGGFHHAFADHAEGFCYLNDVAIAMRHVQSANAGTLHRFAVIDTDLHQGNGTAHIFRDDPGVFTFSIHQENNYPVKETSDLDIGLPDDAGDAEYLPALEKALNVIFSEMNPQFAIYVAGTDPFETDQLGGLRLTRAGMMARERMVFRFCRDGNTPVMVVLGGGYAKDLADTVDLHVNTYLAMKEFRPSS